MRSSVLRKAISVALIGATLMAGSGICVSATSGGGVQFLASGDVVSVMGDTVGTAVQVDDCIKVVNRVSGVGLCDVISENPTGRVGVWELHSHEAYVWYENGVFPFYKVKDELGKSVDVDKMTYLETQVFVRETGAKSWKKVATGKDGRVSVDFGKDGVFDVCIKSRVRMSSFENNVQGETEKWIKEYYHNVSVGEGTLGLYGNYASGYAGMNIAVKWGSSDSLNKYFSDNYANRQYFKSKVMKATKNVSVVVSDVSSGLKKVELWYRPTGTTTWKRMSYGVAENGKALLDWRMDKEGKYDFLVKSFSNAGGVHRAYAMDIEVGIDDVCSREGYAPVYYEGVQGLLPFSSIAMCKKGTYYITSASDFESKGTGAKWTKIKSGGDNGFVATSDEWEEVFYAFNKAGEYVVAFKVDGYTFYTKVLVVKEDSVIDFSTAEAFKEIDSARRKVESAKEAFKGDDEGYEAYIDAWDEYEDTIFENGGGIIKEVVSNSVSSINVLEFGDIAFADYYDAEGRGYCVYDAVMPVWGYSDSKYSGNMTSLKYAFGDQFFGRDYFSDVSHVDTVEVSREGWGYRTVFDVNEIDKYVDRNGDCTAVIGTGVYDMRITYTWFGRQYTKVLKNVPVYNGEYPCTELDSFEFSLSNGGENPYTFPVRIACSDRLEGMWLGGNRVMKLESYSVKDSDGNLIAQMDTEGVQDAQVFVRKNGTKSWKNVTLGFRKGNADEAVFANVNLPCDGGFYDVCLKVKMMEDGVSKWRKVYFKDVAFESYRNESLGGLYSFDTLSFSGVTSDKGIEIANILISAYDANCFVEKDKGYFENVNMFVEMWDDVAFTDIYYVKQSDYDSGNLSWKRLGRVYSGRVSGIKLDAEGEYVVAFKGYDKNKKVVRTLYVEGVTIV